MLFWAVLQRSWQMLSLTVASVEFQVTARNDSAQC
jgi:hypothetical protein